MRAAGRGQARWSAARLLPAPLHQPQAQMLDQRVDSVDATQPRLERHEDARALLSLSGDYPDAALRQRMGRAVLHRKLALEES
jgi:hypothetical protein